MVVDGHPLPRPAQHLLQQLSAPGTDHLHLQLCPLMDPGNGGARRDVVELVEQQQLPQLLQLLLPRLPDRPARQHLFRHVVFHRLQSGLRPADAPLGPGLRGQGSPVPRQIQLAAVDILNLLLLRPPEEAHRVLHMAPGRALQIPAAQGRLHHLPGGASAAVSVAEGEHEAIDALLLDPVVLPPGDQLPGREHGVVPPEQVGQHPAAVQSLPPEEVIGEGLRLRVLAGELLGGKIGDLALLHDLGQRRRKAEGIRHPGHKAVHSQLLPEPALSPDELPDEAFPGGDVGITLHPQRPLGIKSPGGGLFFHPPVDVRIKGLQILQYRRLAEQEPVVRILLHQRQLVGVGPGRLPHGLLHRPEPGQVQVGLSEDGIVRRGGTVPAGQQGLQIPVRLHCAGGEFLLRQLEVRRIGELFQSLNNFHGPQALLRQLLHQAVEDLVIHGRLEQRLVPAPQQGRLYRDLGLRGLGHRLLIGTHGARALPAEAMARVALRVNVVHIPRPGGAGEGDIFVLPVDGPGLPAVDPDQHLLPGPQGEDGPLSLQHLRNDGLGMEPPVLPLLPPPGPRLNGDKPAFDGFVKGQLIHGGEKGQGQRDTRRKIVLFKLLRPDPEPVFPLPANIHRIPLLRLSLQTLAEKQHRQRLPVGHGLQGDIPVERPALPPHGRAVGHLPDHAVLPDAAQHRLQSLQGHRLPGRGERVQLGRVYRRGSYHPV